MGLRKRAPLLFLLLTISLNTVQCQHGEHRSISEAPDKVLILKSRHTLILQRDGHNLKTYHVALGRGGLSPKRKRGDHRTPEGSYLIDLKREPSRFYRALKISYPSKPDLENAQHSGVEPGGDIEIHGLPLWLSWLGPVQHLVDWTDGCIAVSNDEIDEIWPLVEVGTPVEIRH